MHLKNKWFMGIIINVLLLLILIVVPENKIFTIRNLILVDLLFVGIYFFIKISKVPNSLITLLIILLPLNSLLNIILFHFFDIRGFSLNIFKAWKDMLLLIALLYWGIYQIKNPSVFKFKDKKVLFFVSMFALLEIIYILLPIGPANFFQKVYSFRTDTFYLFFFLLGILIPKLDFNKILKVILYSGLVFAGIAIIERFVSPVPLLIWLGMPDYTLYMTGGLPHTQGGISYTYWAAGGIRRVGSLLLNPLDLAAFCLFALPTIFILKNKKQRIFAAILLSVGIIFTLSRMPILILCLHIIGVIIINNAKYIKKVLIWGSGTAAILFFLVFLFMGNFRNYVINTITFKEPSARGHLHDWLLALENIIKHPFGMGLATSGSAGARFGNFGGGENQYLILGVQLGWLGIIIFICMLVSILFYLVKHDKENKTVNFWLISTILLLMLSGITQQSFLNITITCITFLSIGYILKERKSDEQKPS
jgi:hypothetical protein